MLDARPDAEWRSMFALARYGSSRCPSEFLALMRADIDWERSRITVRSPKTEHLAGHGTRQIPLFPELLPYLQEAFDKAPDGAVYVINRYRGTRTNLRTQLCRMIRKAGLEPWPKVWQNPRSSRETELAEQWPIHVVCKWIGNTEAVAREHYLQVTDDHFELAARSADGMLQKAVQNPVQPAVAGERPEMPDVSDEIEKSSSGNNLREYALCDANQDRAGGDSNARPRD